MPPPWPTRSSLTLPTTWGRRPCTISTRWPGTSPAARLIRTFNSLGWENFADPEIGGEQIDLFYCGDPAARAVTEQLIADVGLRPVYLGGVETATALDGMTRVWFILVFGQNKGRHIAFKMLSE